MGLGPVMLDVLGKQLTAGGRGAVAPSAGRRGDPVRAQL